MWNREEQQFYVWNRCGRSYDVTKTTFYESRPQKRVEEYRLMCWEDWRVYRTIHHRRTDLFLPGDHATKRFTLLLRTSCDVVIIYYRRTCAIETTHRSFGYTVIMYITIVRLYIFYYKKKSEKTLLAYTLLFIFYFIFLYLVSASKLCRHV